MRQVALHDVGYDHLLQTITVVTNVVVGDDVPAHVVAVVVRGQGDVDAVHIRVQPQSRAQRQSAYGRGRPPAGQCPLGAGPLQGVDGGRAETVEQAAVAAGGVGGVLAELEQGAGAGINRLTKKYLGVDEYPYRAPGERRVQFRVRPEVVSGWGKD
jgi:hypothetical protein